MMKVVQRFFLTLFLLFLLQGIAMPESLKSSINPHFPGWEKLNLPLKNYLENLKNQKLDLIVRANKSIGESEKETLKKVGFQTKSVIPTQTHTLLTGSILASEIEKLAALPFIDVIELSTRLQYQK